MIAWLAPHAIAAILLTIAMFYGFASGRLSVEIISLLVISAIAFGLYFFPLPGQRPTDGLVFAFAGFGHYALVTICALMIMGRGLVVTGALEPVARLLTRVWRFNAQFGLLVTLVLAFTLSMLVNDTPVLVLMLPIMANIAARGGLAASKTLIPINSAVLIGGMATTIGTSTNLLVVAIASDLGLPPMNVFHFAPIVLVAAVVAMPFIWLVMPRLLPDNSGSAGGERREYFATLRLSDSKADSQRSLEVLAKLLPEGAELSETTDEAMVSAGRAGITATHDALDDAARLLDATAAPRWLMERLRADQKRPGHDISVVEMAVSGDAGLVGKSIPASDAAHLYGVAILGVHQAPARWRETRPRNAEGPLAEGDILLVAGSAVELAAFAQAENLLVLEGARELPRTVKAPLALAIMAVAIFPASLGLVPIAVSSLGGAIAMLMTGCVRFDRVGRALSAKVIVLVAASITIGKFLLESGAAEWLGGIIALLLQFLPDAGVIIAIMLFVTVLTNFASNTTAAAVGTPIAFSIGEQLGIPVEPLVLSVLFGCNLCYATPVAYQTNMLIMSAGDYRFGDYTRTGLPLVALMIVTLSGLLVLRYGLY